MFIHRHRVQFFETDLMGIVHHSNYLRYFEMSRVEWLMANPLSLDAPANWAVLDASTRYVKPLRFGEIIEVGLVPRMQGNRLFFTYQVKNQLGEISCEGETSHTLVDAQMKVIKFNSQIKSWFQGVTHGS